MGQNSRSRRAAKRRKQKARTRNKQAASSQRRQDSTSPDEPVPCRCEWCHQDESNTRSKAEDLLLQRVAELWEHGWQPAEVVRQARRSADQMAADLAALVIVVDDDRRGTQQRDSLWVAQVDQIRRKLSNPDLGDGWLDRRRPTDPGQRSRIDTPKALMITLAKLGPIHRLIPPPGSNQVDVVRLQADQHEADPLLGRVRALLAKAESSEYAAEAEAFTVKAQALISRHALEGLLRATVATGCRPACIRISVDEPYVGAKARLLHAVADASRCCSILLRSYAMCSVIGRPEDLRHVEILFTSLLVQAQGALNEVGRDDPPGAPSRRRSVRSAFLVGYATRIGERLIAERDQATSDFGSGALPILAKVDAAVDDEVERLFGDGLTSNKSRSCNAFGWLAGSVAAEHAQIRDGGLRSAAERPQLESGILPG